MTASSPSSERRSEDGRYAVTGPLLITGSREDVTAYARCRAERAGPEARAWLQTVVGALAIDSFDAAPALDRSSSRRLVSARGPRA